MTGLTFLSADLAGKRLQLLKEIATAVTRVGVLFNPEHPDDELLETREAARRLGIQVHALGVRGATDYERAFQATIKARVQRSSPGNRLRPRSMARGSWNSRAREGALLSYGPDLDPRIWRAAVYSRQDPERGEASGPPGRAACRVLSRLGR